MGRALDRNKETQVSVWILLLIRPSSSHFLHRMVSSPLTGEGEALASSDPRFHDTSHPPNRICKYHAGWWQEAGHETAQWENLADTTHLGQQEVKIRWTERKNLVGLPGGWGESYPMRYEQGYSAVSCGRACWFSALI